MDCRSISARSQLYFDQNEKEAALLLESACVRSQSVIRQVWGLHEPKKCRIYVMTSLLHFIFHSAPWHTAVLWGLLLPLWYLRVRKVSRFCGGWTQRYRDRPAVGVKPPRLIEQADKSIGELIFENEPDPNRKLEHIACHELTHAYSAHLHLPMWLNEGIAMVAVDRYFGKQTVKSSTLNALARFSPKHRNWKYRDLSRMKNEDIAYQYSRGYWITRFLLQRHPDLLQEILSRRQSHRSLEKRVAAALGCSRHSLWHAIDNTVSSHFGKGSLTGEQPSEPDN